MEITPALVAKYTPGLEVPFHLHDGLRDYVLWGQPTGDFLRSVISNDLREAVARADAMSALGLVDIVKWLYQVAPGGCWGTPARYREWTESGGLAAL